MAIILIAGASKGIGLVVARQLSAAGHTVYGTSRNPDGANVDGVRLIALDVTDDDSVRACVNRVISEAGRIDVLINNVGYDLYGAAEDTSVPELLAQMDANFVGAVRLIQAVLPGMRANGGGKIVNMSSIGGRVALPFNSAYSASKFALEGYSESLRVELLPHNIYVSLIEPGQARTDTLETSIRSTANAASGYESARIAARAREAGRTAALLPEQIAAVVRRVIEDPRPKLRYPVGSQARMVMLMGQWMPPRWLESFLLRQFVQPVMSKS